MGPEDLVTSVEAMGDKVVVRVRGDVDLVTADELRGVLDEALTTSSHLDIDLSGLTFIDSSGLSALVHAHRAARDAGGVAVLRDPPSMLRRLLDITKLDSLFVVETAADPGERPVPTADEA